jgi:uncharacterized glyoxalase superfamily metalloenzyme YdcJ
MSVVSKNNVRKQFAIAMSTMYQQEVPLYGTLKNMVEDINRDELNTNVALVEQLTAGNNLARLAEERHGAIRVGSAKELSAIRRLFSVMGMYPVGYYDLSVAGIPVHSTAFRPLTHADLSVNAFRVFTSLLRLDFISDKVLREKVEGILSQRRICSPRLLALINQFESSGDLKGDDAKEFLEESLNVFRWHPDAAVDVDLYQELLRLHPLIADVVSFKGPHINHLTPATVNIDRAQQEMKKRGIDAKAIIEGPPTRHCPILLRQTAFKSLSERVVFPHSNGERVVSSHTARFGEIEQRGIALTPKGQALYDRLLNQTRARVVPDGKGDNAGEYDITLGEEFAAFPDNYNELRLQNLAYFYFSVNHKVTAQPRDHERNIKSLMANGHVRFDPIIYEDFLPVSAAGIFQSNVDSAENKSFTLKNNRDEFESALGASVECIFEHYEAIQKESIDCCVKYFSKKYREK